MSEAPDWLQRAFKRPLKDVSTLGDPRFANIYSPLYDADEVRKYMSSYYESQDSAQGQDAKLNLNDYYLGLLREALERTGGAAGPAPAILEIGCGFGSATFPLLELYPESKIVASEFSLSMLHILKGKLDGNGHQERCALLQLNAEDMDFHDGTFDLVVGAAVLHHLFHPEKVLERCAKVLRSGGRAVFFEPFESGYDIMSLVYQEALRDPRSFLINPRKRRYLRYCVSKWRLMRSTDKTSPFFTGADDKWLFTPSFFENHTSAAGFRHCEMYGLEKSGRPFEALIRTHLEGNNVKSMPKWFWRIVDHYEGAFSDELKRTLFTEGCVILRK
ncbi:MAG: class I SAM-dependent methyltransferase [Betaproteobacteria bacterium]|nr:class I SAM-dependent methyltransferase [Betaproteobacteria bacterium]